MSKHAIKFDPKKGLTKQSFKDECNINKIMARFQRTGAIDHYAKHGPQYSDITSGNLHSAMNIISDAESMFEELPSSVRKKFQNDPAQFLDFVQDPNNLEEMRELGLAHRQQNVTTINDDAIKTPVEPPSENPTPPSGEPSNAS